jgi:GNAT superfamily N-acetyltransferase
MRSGDGAACAKLWIEFGRALASRMPDRFREPEERGLDVWFEQQIAETPPGALRALAEVEGVAVGLAHAVLRPPHEPAGSALMPAHLQPRAVLEDIVVAETLRNRGIGEQLVRYVEDWARAHGAKAIMLNSDPEGPVRRFYERLGYGISAALYDKEL